MNILIIDDEELILKSMKKIFELNKWIVNIAKGGEEGLLLWELNNPDIVFLDLIMPRISGLEVLNRAPVDNSTIILMSAHQEFGLEKKFSSRVYKFIEKPFTNIQSLIKLVTEIKYEKSKTE